MLWRAPTTRHYASDLCLHLKVRLRRSLSTASYNIFHDIFASINNRSYSQMVFLRNFQHARSSLGEPSVVMNDDYGKPKEDDEDDSDNDEIGDDGDDDDKKKKKDNFVALFILNHLDRYKLHSLAGLFQESILPFQSDDNNYLATFQFHPAFQKTLNETQQAAKNFITLLSDYYLNFQYNPSSPKNHSHSYLQNIYHRLDLAWVFPGLTKIVIFVGNKNITSLIFHHNITNKKGMARSFYRLGIPNGIPFIFELNPSEKFLGFKVAASEVGITGLAIVTDSRCSPWYGCLSITSGSSGHLEEVLVREGEKIVAVCGVSDYGIKSLNLLMLPSEIS